MASLSFGSTADCTIPSMEKELFVFASPATVRSAWTFTVSPTIAPGDTVYSRTKDRLRLIPIRGSWHTNTGGVGEQLAPFGDVMTGLTNCGGGLIVSVAPAIEFIWSPRLLTYT